MVTGGWLLASGYRNDNFGNYILLILGLLRKIKNTKSLFAYRETIGFIYL